MIKEITLKCLPFILTLLYRGISAFIMASHPPLVQLYLPPVVFWGMRNGSPSGQSLGFFSFCNPQPETANTCTLKLIHSDNIQTQKDNRHCFIHKSFEKRTATLQNRYIFSSYMSKFAVPTWLYDLHIWTWLWHLDILKYIIPKKPVKLWTFPWNSQGT